MAFYIGLVVICAMEQSNKFAPLRTFATLAMTAILYVPLSVSIHDISRNESDVDKMSSSFGACFLQLEIIWRNLQVESAAEYLILLHRLQLSRWHYECASKETPKSILWTKLTSKEAGLVVIGTPKVSLGRPDWAGDLRLLIPVWVVEFQI